MMNTRIVLLAACCALTPSAWASAGLTSAGVDTSTNNNNAQNEPTLAQVAPVANQGQPGSVGAGANAAVPNPAAAGTQTGPNAQHAANAAADGSKPATAAVAVAPAPPPPPPDPSTLPVSVIRPLNKSADVAAPKADAVSAVTATTKPTRHTLAEPPTEAAAPPPPPPPSRAPQPAPARAEPARTAGDVAAAITTPAAATADGSANGYVFYTGMGIAGIILALSLVGYMRAGNDSGRPRA